MLREAGNIINEGLELTLELLEFVRDNGYYLSLKTGDYTKVKPKRNHLPYNLDLLKAVNDLYLSGNLYMPDFIHCFNLGTVGIIQQAFKKNGMKSLTKRESLDLYGDRTNAKREETNLVFYGCKCALQNPEVDKKAEASMIKNHGVRRIAQSPEYQERRRQYWLDKIGVDHPMKHPTSVNNMKQTNLKRIGYATIFEAPWFRENTKATHLANLGVENPMQNPEIAKKSRDNKRAKDTRFAEMERLAELAKDDESYAIQLKLFIRENFGSAKQLEFFRKYDLHEERQFLPEVMIAEILDGFGIEYIHNAKKAHGVRRENGSLHELDFWIPSLRLGIEVNGLAFHSTDFHPHGLPKSADYHNNKLKSFLDSDIKLISFTDYEIYKFRELVIEIIKCNIGLSDIENLESLESFDEFIMFNEIEDIRKSLNYNLYENFDTFELRPRFIYFSGRVWEYWDNGVLK